MSDEKKTILVVDDEADVVTYMTTLFEDHGYSVVACGTGGEAVDLAQRKKPDLVTLDIMMPEESGIKAYKELRKGKDTRHIPIIIVTGIDNPDLEKFMSTRRIAPPPDAYYEKPIDRDKLLAKVRELVGG